MALAYLSPPGPYCSQGQLPGGRAMSDELYYNGSSQTFDNGNTVVYGQRGEVVGPATSKSHKGKGLMLLFPGNKGNVNCYLTQLSRNPPVRARR